MHKIYAKGFSLQSQLLKWKLDNNLNHISSIYILFASTVSLRLTWLTLLSLSYCYGWCILGEASQLHTHVLWLFLSPANSNGELLCRTWDLTCGCARCWVMRGKCEGINVLVWKTLTNGSGKGASTYIPAPFLPPKDCSEAWRLHAVSLGTCCMPKQVSLLGNRFRLLECHHKAN